MNANSGQEAFNTPNKNYNDLMTIDDVFTPNECDHIISLGYENISSSGETRGGKSGIRDCFVGAFPFDAETKYIYNRILKVAKNVNNRFLGFDIRGIYNAQYIEYSHEGAKYDWHTDHGPGQNSLRKLSIVIQLSEPDDYQGGDLEVWYGPQPKSATRKRGSAIIFPSFVLHRVTPVDRGIRRSLVTWVLGPPWR
ncbi:2OG-Fe(II) oxygenase [Limimonas halophila]|uniref:2OG-Fe(II) oxygenase n=1 Tax=Limimonas halophila TaxID=1082479 RepID=UPI000B800ACD|nr:2OG-Fe(II) oxygenase [Limimonas halophila]